MTIVPTGAGDDPEALGEVSYQLPRRTRLLVTPGQVVEAGDAVHEGSRNPADLLRLKGATPTELYLVDEVQKVYKSQGVEIHDKHIELIVRQMMKKVKIESAGETELTGTTSSTVSSSSVKTREWLDEGGEPRRTTP